MIIRVLKDCSILFKDSFYQAFMDVCQPCDEMFANICYEMSNILFLIIISLCFVCVCVCVCVCVVCGVGVCM